MIYEKKYISYLISESGNFPEIKPILDNYFLDKVIFDDLIILIENGGSDVISYRNFKKSENIDKLFGK